MTKKSKSSAPSGVGAVTPKILLKSNNQVPVASPAAAAKKSKLKKNKKKTSASGSFGAFAQTPIYDVLRSFGKAPDQWAARYILILTAIILRSAVGLGSFLGESQPPINGDFEAQRHWMELTIHLPIEDWYFYDLQYWGLDYPPLTAFHLYLCGKVGSFINSQWFALGASRGLESSGLKTFMRFTSLLSECLVYFPALLGFIALIGKKLNLPRMDQVCILVIIMCQPSLILIDHGHFQFNSIMLAFFLFSLTDLCKSNYVLASVWFVMCLTFKQMGLYYAPFIFCYLLSKCFTNKFDLKDGKFWSVIASLKVGRLLSIGITVIISFLAVLSPFFYFTTSGKLFTTLQQILIRVFPFQRGLFEDKVANFWCTSNLIIKYRNIFSQQQLTQISLAATLVAIAPPCCMIIYKNMFAKGFLNHYAKVNKHIAVIYGFAATSWAFYLFSFQVHEKTVLVPLLPSTLLYVLDDGNTIAMVQWINNIAVYSMWPLLKKDGLALQYVVVIALSNFLVRGFLLPQKNIFWTVVISLSYLGAFAIHAIEFALPPPEIYPDLWVILNTTLSFGCFGLFWLWILYNMYKL